MDEKKMIFVKWFPDDVLNGTSLLTWQSELTYYRLINHIYTTNDTLFDDEITWQVLTSKFNGNASAIKDELLKKKKIYIKDGKIKNKGCDKWLKEAKDNFETNSERGKKGAKARWDKPDAPSNAQALATTNYKPSSINYKKNIYSINFTKFWESVNNKIGKGDAEKNFYKIGEEWKEQPDKLAELYNNYYSTVTERKWAKHPSSWLSAKRYLDEMPATLSYKEDEDATLSGWVNAFKNPTNFSKEYAKKNKGIVQKMLEKNMITDDEVKKLGVNL